METLMEFNADRVWTDEQGYHEVHRFGNGLGVSVWVTSSGGLLGEQCGEVALLVPEVKGWEVTEQIADQFVWMDDECRGRMPSDLGAHFDATTGVGRWVGLDQLEAILRAVRSIGAE
jgi:hypothetical protein